MARVFIGLGANLGAREANIARALELIAKSGAAEVIRVSGLIETEPVGGPGGQPAYINGAAEIETQLAPAALLATLKDIERRLGRVERERWGPREIDLDILLYDDLTVKSADLEIPHPRMLERAFVLRPLAEIAPRIRHPVSGETIARHVKRLGN